MHSVIGLQIINPLVIPDSVTSISVSAFYGWSSNNHPLVIPNSVTSIGNHVFAGWSSNNHPLIIPSSITSIGNAAFYGWLSVPYVEMKATYTTIIIKRKRIW